VTEARRSETPANQSVERAVRLLAFFTPDEPELTLAEITLRLGAPRATTHRYAVALRRAGMLRYDAAVGTYTLGPRVLELAAAALAGLRIVKIAGPTMERLLTAANETVVLSVFDGESPVVVRVEDNTDRLVRIVVRTGARLPRTTSAQGKVFCAFGGDEQASNGISQTELARIRRTRVATNSDLVEGIRAIATPVFQEQELVAAMALVGTTASIPEEVGSPTALLLIDAAASLSAEVGSLRHERRL
jgi:DNA-binding IclR family transcriptional regulator